MSLKSILVSTLLATAAIATDHMSGGGGGSGPPMGGDGGNGWGNWQPGMGGEGPPAVGAASCPSGCQPISIPTCAVPPPATPPGQLIVQVVSVADANGSLKYFPNKVTAPVGSIVQFQFHPKNHTITESSFAEPCKPLAANLTSSMRPGLRSGFIPVTGQEPFTPVYNVLVNDTKPIWIFCGQTNHCQKGMAMVINQNDSSPNTIDAYISKAAQLPLVNVTAPPPPAGSPPPPPPANSPPPPPFGAPPSSSVFVPPPPVQTVQPPTSSVAVAPATFTGAAVPAFVPQSSTGVIGLVLGAVLAMW